MTNEAPNAKMQDQATASSALGQAPNLTATPKRGPHTISRITSNPACPDADLQTPAPHSWDSPTPGLEDDVHGVSSGEQTQRALWEHPDRSSPFGAAGICTVKIGCTEARTDSGKAGCSDVQTEVYGDRKDMECSEQTHGPVGNGDGRQGQGQCHSDNDGSGKPDHSCTTDMDSSKAVAKAAADAHAEGGMEVETKAQAGAESDEDLSDAECSDEGMSALELERQEIIAANQRVLESLKIAEAASAMQPRRQPPPPKRPPARLPQRAMSPEAPRRTSTPRLAAIKARILIGKSDEEEAEEVLAAASSTIAAAAALAADGVANSEADEEKTVEEAPQEPEHYDDSSVYQYVCDGGSSGSEEAQEQWPMELGNHERLKGFAFCSAKHFVDVKRVYSMAINRDSGMNAPLLAAAGHQGMVSILRLFKKDKEQEPLLSFQAHKKWIGNVFWIDRIHFLTSSTDGCVRIWDSSKKGAANGKALMVAESGKVNAGADIFSADLHCSSSQGMGAAPHKLVTGSRDGVLALSHVTNTGIQAQSLHPVHDRSVKCVSISGDGQSCVSTGNDYSVRVTDLRILSQGSVLQWEGNSVINSCSWQPDGSLIMSAGIDHTIKLWDPRKGSNSPPLHTLKGHSEIYGAGKCIYHPIFYDHGRFIVTPGEKSTRLSLYRVCDGATISRGDIGCIALTFACSGTTLIHASNAVIRLMEPVLR
eukprot:CAMPEP_0174309638 /NCGR_PEP_ID=MMETSP0810-20121108/2544_1 /TAXON_ID=73025 ORGANISM="Eutreptiella gymnastica-like, Strain CCMP1594" /NCGR_SAMPLE_ID=MMETSP0810 /ASSEMBLY_ACC=CAM_ASM_000659 /LENGTH=705 /DNA_ID=CAMNT_0015417339 /DNA_START=160 /DNA_END=2277 /DNA_ORIENTATION=+